MDEVWIVSAFFLWLQNLGLVQQRPVVTQHLNLTTMIDWWIHFCISLWFLTFFCNVFDLLHLLVSCELGLHFVKKSWFALSEIYLTKLTTNYIGNVCFSFRHTGFHWWWANTFKLRKTRSIFMEELVEHSSHLGHFNMYCNFIYINPRHLISLMRL